MAGPTVVGITWVTAQGTVGALVSVMFVTDPVAIIESFDLHICSCALLCTMTSSKQRVRDSYLTRLCAKACLQQSACALELHPGLAQQDRLAERYALRNLSIDYDALASYKSEGTKIAVPPLAGLWDALDIATLDARGISQLGNKMYCFWEIGVHQQV